MDDPTRPTHFILGCGYLGRVVAKRWIAAGCRVAALTRSNGEELRTIGVEPIVGDVTAPETLRLPAVDTVLYAVGLDRSSGMSMRDVYVGGLTNVLSALPLPPVFVYISSTSVYGQVDGSCVDEESVTEPRDESGRVVLECERIIHTWMPTAIVLRFAGIHGPDRVINRARIESGEPIQGDPEGWLNLIHVEEGAGAIVAAAARAKPGSTFNVCADPPLTRRDHYSAVARSLGAPEPRFTPSISSGPNRRVSSRRIREELGFHASNR